MEEIIQEALSKGVEMHVAGEFELAGKLYSSVMQMHPKHADANIEHIIISLFQLEWI